MKNQEMHPLFFVPKRAELLPLIAKGIKDGDSKMLYFGGSYEGMIFDAIDYLVMNYHQEGKINLHRVFDEVKSIAKTVELAKLYRDLKIKKSETQIVECSSDEPHLFAVGRLNVDYCDSDNDTCETAGCYRNYKAIAGAVVKFYLIDDLRVKAVYESNLVVDHYNNNFFGNSTGGGHTTYEIGQKPTLRSVLMGKELFWENWSKDNENFKVTIKKIDVNKLRKIAVEKCPEFGFLFA